MACATRGFDAVAFAEVGALIGDVLDAVARGGHEGAALDPVRERVLALCRRYPIY